MHRTRSFVVVSLALLGACGSPEAATAPAEIPAPAPAAAAPAAPTPAAAPAAAATPTPAPTATPTLEELIRTVPPVVPAPAAQREGPLALEATVCTLDGTPIIGDDAFRSIGPVAWSSDGALYLLDQDARLRRYTIATGPGCALTLDTSMGDGGRLDLGSGLGAAPEHVVADAHGHVFVSSGMRGTDRITGTHVDYHCETTGEIAIAPSGTDGFALFGTGPVRRVTFTDEGCTVADWSATDLFARVDSVSFLDAGHVLVGGHDTIQAPHRARIFDLSGRPQGEAFGDAGDSLAAPDHFCHVHQAVACGTNTCVLDGNCRKLRVFDRQRAIVGAVDVSRLVGVGYPWFPGMSGVRDGTAYVTVVQQRGEGYPRPDVYDGFVMRVTGL